MKKFTYRKQMVLIGRLVDETETHYNIETVEDTYSLEKEVTIVNTLITKNDYISGIKHLIKEIGIMNVGTYFVHYFGGGVKGSTTSSISKSQIEGCYNYLLTRATLREV